MFHNQISLLKNLYNNIKIEALIQEQFQIFFPEKGLEEKLER